MEDNELKEELNNNEGQLDVFLPSVNHKILFSEKLKRQNKNALCVNAKKRKRFSNLAIAASLILIVSLSTIIIKPNKKAELASVSQQMENTQDFFTLAIKKQLDEINENTSAEVSQLVEDAMKQLKKIESDYELLQKDLIQSNNDKRVISAMIINFQKRALLLESVLEKINKIKNFNTYKNEHNLL